MTPVSIPRLSLCIATMNRARYLENMLASIADQLPPDGEVAILDSSADDGTERVVASLRPRLPHLRYERRPPSGFDRDYATAVEMSRGEYCWLLPDDDELRPGAIAAVLAVLARRPDCVIVNAEVRDQVLGEVLSPTRMRLAADRTFAPEEFEAFARTCLEEDYLSYVGAIVIRRSVWDERQKEAYFGTDFMPVGVILQQAFAGPAITMSHPWISIRYGVALWENRSVPIWLFRWPKLIWDSAALSEETKSAIVAREPWRDTRRLIFFRAMGWLSWRSYREWLAAQPLGLTRRLGVWALCLTPFPVANRLMAAFMRRRWPHAKIGMWDLDRSLARWRAQRGRPPVK